MSSHQTAPISEVPVLRNGRFEPSTASRFGQVYNPSSGRVIARVPLCSAEQTGQVVEAAAAALGQWSSMPVVERARIMFGYWQLINASIDELAALVTREHGKTLAEAQAEVKRGLEMVEFACSIPSLIMGQTLANIATNVDAQTERHPVGVCVGITPYNFPVMVPMWMFPVALVCGNTFVLKPSEKVPLSAVRLGELLLAAGLPDGVFNIAHGDRECVSTLLEHPKVAAISFVGSTAVARTIYQTATAAGKRVQAAGGAKNHLIIMPDADLSRTVKAIGAAAYGCGGQRCMSGSVAVAVGAVGDRLVDGLCRHGQQLQVGPTDGGQQVDIGPLIRPEHVDRVASYLEVAVQDGAVVALDGRRSTDASPGDAFLLGPSVIDRVEPHMRVWQDEIFGPVLSVVRVDSIDEALAIGSKCQYGNGASIFTRSGHAARQFKQHFNAGMIGINVGVPAPMAWFPFTGWNRSFFGDLHIQGHESIQFYTRQKVTLSQWFASDADRHVDPLWSSLDGAAGPATG